MTNYTEPTQMMTVWDNEDSVDKTDESYVCGNHLFSGECDESCIQDELDEMDDPFFSEYVY